MTVTVTWYHVIMCLCCPPPTDALDRPPRAVPYHVQGLAGALRCLAAQHHPHHALYGQGTGQGCAQDLATASITAGGAATEAPCRERSAAGWLGIHQVNPLHPNSLNPTPTYSNGLYPVPPPEP